MSDIVFGGRSDIWSTNLGCASVGTPDIRPPPQTISYNPLLNDRFDHDHKSACVELLCTRNDAGGGGGSIAKLCTVVCSRETFNEMKTTVLQAFSDLACMRQPCEIFAEGRSALKKRSRNLCARPGAKSGPTTKHQVRDSEWMVVDFVPQGV